MPAYIAECHTLGDKNILEFYILESRDSGFDAKHL